MNETLQGVQLRRCLTAPFLLLRHAPRGGGLFDSSLHPSCLKARQDELS